MFQDLFGRTADSMKGKMQEVLRTDKDAAVPAALKVMQAGSISVRAAIRIFYDLMAIDGVARAEEREKIEEIGENLDKNFPSYKEELFSQCEKVLQQGKESGRLYDSIKAAADHAVLLPVHADDPLIPAKVLIWDMLTIAQSDNAYDANERELILHFIRKYRIDESVFFEMEASMDAVQDIEKEIAWVKTTEQPYLQIEEIVSELTARENAIYDSVKALTLL